MPNDKIVKKIRTYVKKFKSVDVKWYIKNELNLDKNAREIDIIVNAVVNNFWFSEYKGHNPSDVSVRLNPARYPILIGIIGAAVAIFNLVYRIIDFY